MSARVLEEGRSGHNTGKLGGVAAITAALVLAVAGCGGSEASESESAASAQSAPSGQRPQFDQDAFTQLRQCLEENGVTLPSPGQQGAPPSGMQGGPPALGEGAQKAFEACSDYLPSPPQGQGSFGFSG